MQLIPSGVLVFITDFGDQAIVAPAVFLILVALCMQTRWRLAASWAVASCFALGSIGVSKAALYACGWQMAPAPMHWMAVQSPSGHTVSVALLVGGITALFSQKTGWAAFRTAGVVAAMASLVIGWTRISLQFHSLAEALIGLMVGVSAIAMLTVLAGPDLARRASRWLLVGVAGVVIGLHGHRAPAEQLIRVKLAMIIRGVVPACIPPVQGG